MLILRIRSRVSLVSWAVLDRGISIVIANREQRLYDTIGSQCRLTKHHDVQGLWPNPVKRHPGRRGKALDVLGAGAAGWSPGAERQ